MTSLTEETVYTTLHYHLGSMNSYSPTDPLWTPYLSQTPWNASETPWGSLRASLTTPALKELWNPSRDFSGSAFLPIQVTPLTFYKNLSFSLMFLSVHTLLDCWILSSHFYYLKFTSRDAQRHFSLYLFSNISIILSIK